MVQVVSVMKLAIFLILMLATVISANVGKIQDLDKLYEGKHGSPANESKKVHTSSKLIKPGLKDVVKLGNTGRRIYKTYNADDHVQ